MTSSVTLLTAVKRRLNVTWDYDDDEIIDIIEEGQQFIQDRVGEVDFYNDISALRLLKEYCRYAWNGSVSYFESDYRSDILNLQINNAI